MPHFTEDWYSQDDQSALHWATILARSDGDWIELGCWEGRSTCLLAATGKPLTAVDSWVVGGPHYKRDVYPTFLENIKPFPNVTVKRMDVLEFMRAYTGDLAFLHVDAAHDYDHVAETLRLALPRLVPGGVLCGHDATFPDVQRAVCDVLHQFNRAANVWTYKHWTPQP